MENGTIECPDEKITVFNSESIPTSGKAVCFGIENCDKCSKRDKCTKGENGRTIHINPDESEILEDKAFQKTDVFKKDYAKRANVERTISELTKHGARQGRFIGTAKIRFQLLLSAINHNVKKIMRYITNKNPDMIRNTGSLCPN